ncbi:MAG: DNA replication/repair protein RecF [Bacteroidales bacterium]|nr:DNA replication/repair protein RecF [Bacteroidales bacterium]
MQINHLSILNFKNIREAELTFSSGLNCFVGNNGEGKTNLLDAIYYLGFCKSHTNPSDLHNIHHEADFFMLQGTFQNEDLMNEVSCGVKRRQKKTFKYNGKEYERLSEHIGKLPLVLISPSDEDLIREGSDERRRFMDMVITQYDHAYMESLVAYNKALLQRNTLLRDDTEYEASLFEVYELKMAMEGEQIFKKRQAFVKAFTPVFEEYYHYISGGKEAIRLLYTSQLSEGSLIDQLSETRLRDKMLGYTSKGIHKDELQMELDGYPIKRVGSQGQNKSFLIAMKLGQYGFLKRTKQMKPLLLIDDLFDKLDASRVEQILRLVSGQDFGQLFITDTNKEHLVRLLERTGSDYRFFNVTNGVITPMT